MQASGVHAHSQAKLLFFSNDAVMIEPHDIL